MTTRTVDDSNHAPPGAPPTAQYVYVPSSKDYKPASGQDNGDGTASPVIVANQGLASGGTPWPVSVAAGTVTVSNIAALQVVNAIDYQNYNLQAAAFSAATNLTVDYLLSRLELAFSTNASRTITVTAVGNGTVLWQQTNTNLSVEIEFDDPGFDATNQIQVAITQTGSPCLVDVRLAVVEGSSAIAGTATVKGGMVKDANNSTTTPLGAGATFTGTATDLIAAGAEGITYNLYADPDQMVTSPVLSFQFSPDGTNWDVQVPSVIANGHINIPVPLRPVMQFFRIVYTNGSAPQTAFRLTTYLHNTVPDALARTGSQTLQPRDPMLATRALVEPSFKGRLSMLGADRSIGGELISVPYIVQDNWQWNVAFANNNVTTVATGGATTAQAAATGATLTSANAAGASQAQIRGSKKIRYSPGRESRMEVTLGWLQGPLANSNMVAGLSDTPAGALGAGANSVLIGYNGTSFGGFIVSAGTVTQVWAATTSAGVVTGGNQNGDLLDGSGLSSFRSNDEPTPLNLTQMNAFRIRYVWYGVGPVYWEVKSPDDQWTIIHTHHWPNIAVVPYFQNPEGFAVWDVTKGAGAGTGTLQMRSFSGSAGTIEPAINFEPHEIHGHKQVQIALSNQTTSQTAYTVSAGRQLLIHSLTLTANNSSGTNGIIEIRDNASAVYPAVMGGNNTQLALPVSFRTPLVFLTNVTLTIVAGTINYAFSAVGYEKEV